MTDPIRIVLVDDHQLVRNSWRILLESTPGFRVIADFDNAEDAITAVAGLLPDIMLVDVNMSPVNGFELTERVTNLYPSIKIIGLSVNNQPRYAVRMMQLGARGYVTKTSTLQELSRGITLVHQGETYICNEIKKHLSES